MNQHSQNKTPEQMVEAIFALDLDPIKLKLMDKDDGHGWTRAEADYHELEYRRFLALIAKYPDEVITPNKDIDRFWHGHILDTMKYAQDCDHVFGYFLHHFPYFGMRDAEDAGNAAQAAIQTKRLYAKEFGSVAAPTTGYGYCAKAATSYCARADASYCAKAPGKTDVQTDAAGAYCAKTDDSYCARANARNAALVTGKGRPSLSVVAS